MNRYWYPAVFIIAVMSACTSSPHDPASSTASGSSSDSQKNVPSLSRKESRDSHHANQSKIEQKGMEYFRVENDSMILLPFEIEVNLSPKARKRILGYNETIIITVTLSGTPRDERLRAEDGSFDVASAEKEIAGEQIVRFEHIKFPVGVFNQLLQKDVEVFVYFYSGRKSSPNNLLSSDILSDKASNIVQKRFKLDGKLISEDD